jgi:hypothetical protein
VADKARTFKPHGCAHRCAAPTIGSALGVLPGGGAILASFASYTVEKRISKHPEEFGKGAIEGVAGPESANNAGAQTSFIPLLTLGIPANPVMALMVGAMIIQGIVPGPNVADRAADAVLGHHRLDVDRQPDAGGAQPAADRPVGEAADRALLRPVPHHHRLLLDRRLQRELQRLRPLLRSPSSAWSATCW